MTRVIRVFVIIVVSFASLTFALANDDHLKRYESGKLPSPTQPNVDTFKLDNGIVGYLVSDRSLPFVMVSVTAKAGDIYDPSDKVGLTTLTAMTMRTGGAGDLSPEKFDAAVDNIGSTLSISSSAETTVATLKVLTDDLKEGLGLLSDMLYAPKFDALRASTAKSKLLESILRDKDDPQVYSRILFLEEIYGDNSPWARVPTKASIDAIKLNDMELLAQRLFSAPNILIAVSGDVDVKGFTAVANAAFSRAKKDAVSWPDVPKVSLEFKPSEKIVKGPKSQSYVRMGHLGVRRHNPDWFALNVLATILGGGNFKSRLMEDLRTKRGLVYSIGAGFTQGRDYGVFSVRFSTPQAKADEAISLAKNHVSEMATGGDVGEVEFDFAKRSLLASAIFDMASPSAIALDRVNFEIFGYPPDYWVYSYRALQNVTRADVMNAAKKYLHPDGLKVLVLGANQNR